MLAVEFKPALSLFAGRAPVRLPQDMDAVLVQCRQQIQLLELEGFLERQADEDPPPIAVDKIVAVDCR